MIQYLSADRAKDSETGQRNRPAVKPVSATKRALGGFKRALAILLHREQQANALPIVTTTIRLHSSCVPSPETFIVVSAR